MSLQASVHYYSEGGQVNHDKPTPYRGRESRYARGGNPRDMVFDHIPRLNPIKVDIAPRPEKIGIFPDPLKPVLMKRGGMSVSDMKNMIMGSPQPSHTLGGSIHFESGGKVPYTPESKTVLAEIPTKGVDKVPALLQTGEIVIPKKYATPVNKVLKKMGIHLPNC